MALPTINDVQLVEPVLTNMMVGYRQSAANFVAGRAFPSVPVNSDSGTFAKLTKKYFFTDGLRDRAPGDPFARLEFGTDKGTYITRQFAADYALADEVRANSQIPMDLERVAIEFLAQKSLLRKELQFAADFMKTGVWGTDLATARKWNNSSSGDPIGDILLASDTISGATGYVPNTLIIGHDAYRALMIHPDVVDRLKYVMATTDALVASSLTAVLGVNQILVCRANYDATNEASTFAATPIISDKALLIYNNPGAGIFDATAGKTFTWAAGGGEGTIYRYRDNARHADVLQHKEQWDQCVVAADLGYFWSDVIE